MFWIALAAVVVIFGMLWLLWRAAIDKLDRLIHIMTALRAKEDSIMASLDDLALEVASLSSAASAAIALLGQLSAQVAAQQADPAKIQAVLDGMKAATQALSDAVAANSPPPA